MPYLLTPRNPLDEAKDTLSSWHKCMAKSYCKWPVIVAIVIGSLIVLSVVLCVARCLCCGAECACCCFRCCAGCCGSGRGSKHKRMKSDPNAGYPPAYPPAQAPAYPPPAADTQYRSHPAPKMSPVSKYRQPETEAPQFATFETSSKPVHEDSLPAMPEWASAKSTHVEEEVIPEKHGDVELARFDQNGSVAGASLAGTTAVAAVGRAQGRSPVHRSPTGNGYGAPQEYQNQAIANGPQRSPHSPAMHAAQFGQQQDQYRGQSPAQPVSPLYGPGVVGYAQSQPYGRNSPAQSQSPAYAQQNNRPAQGRSPPPMNDYGYGPAELASDYDSAPIHNNSNQGPARSHTPGYAPAELPSDYNTEPPAPNYGPVRSNTPGYSPNQSNAPNYAPARTNTPGYAPARSNTPGYAASSTYTESDFAPEPAKPYPGQQTYSPSEPAYPGQQSYQAFQPTPSSLQPGVGRRPINGSWKDV